MLSFPSTLNKGGSRISIPQTSNSLKDVLNNSMKSAFNASISKTTSGKGYDTDGIRYDEDRDRNYLIDHFDFTNHATLDHESNLLSTQADTTLPFKVWSPLKMNESLFSVVNNYRGYLSNVLIETGNDNEVKDSNGKKYRTHNLRGKVTPSLFNPYHALPYRGIVENVPLLDTQDPTSAQLNVDEYKNLEDCSINELVRLSSSPKSILGQCRYRYSDFMYCKDLGKISNNHMITLRKFAVPVGDDIFKEAVGSDANSPHMGDIGRMITWFDTDDNKLSDIMNYEYQATWKQLNSKIDQKNSQEEDPERGLVGKFINNMSGGYNEQTANGITKTGGLLGTLMESLGLGKAEGTYSNNDVALGRNYDNNKVYEPKDTIQDTHIYEGKLIFKQEFNLTFSYKLRAYDNINPKSAFLDLLGNILATTYRRGTFWGGRNEIIGAKPNKAGWSKYKSITNGIQKGCGDLWANLWHLDGATADGILGSFSQFFTDTLQAFGVNASALVNKIQDTASQMISDPIDTTKNIGQATANAAKKIAASEKTKNLGRAAFGMMLNKLGRPALYAFDSLLTGANVGLWHVTIGNPKNPIAAFGNLIMTGCKITHSGPLGLDDFPTDLTVSVSLKHAMSRDAAGISRMYTKGRNNIYMSLCSPYTKMEYNDGQSATSNIIKGSNGASQLKYIEAPNISREESVKKYTNNVNLSKLDAKALSSNNPSTQLSRKFNESNIGKNWSSIDEAPQSDSSSLADSSIYNITNGKTPSFTSSSVTDVTSDEFENLVSEINTPAKAAAELAQLQKSGIFYNRYAWCGCGIEEFIANKDEQR